jgi:DNA-binding protein HU-beta
VAGARFGISKNRKKSKKHLFCLEIQPQCQRNWIGSGIRGNKLKTLGGIVMALTKAQIQAQLADKTELSKKQVGQFFDELCKLAYKEAKNSFTIPGLGKLVLVNRAARTGRNPATGETIQIPAKKVVKFRVAKAAKDAILGR